MLPKLNVVILKLLKQNKIKKKSDRSYYFTVRFCIDNVFTVARIRFRSQLNRSGLLLDIPHKDLNIETNTKLNIQCIYSMYKLK